MLKFIITSGRNNPNSDILNMHGSLSTIGSFADDFGEADLSLRSYDQGATNQPPCCYNSIMSQEEQASNLFQKRVTGECGRSTEGHQQQLPCLSSKSGKYTFMASGDHKIDVNIREEDVNSSTIVISLSTVVYNLNHDNTLSQEGHTTKKKTRCQGLYSLMTLMMKHSAIFEKERAAAAANDEDDDKSGRGHIGLYDGKFVLCFSNVQITKVQSSSSSKRKLACVLDDFMWKAVEIGRDFATVKKKKSTCEAGTELRQKRLLTRAYNMTMLTYQH